MSNKKFSIDQRLAALESYQILGTPEEKQFDDIVKLASQICETPISLISLVTDTKQWFKAKTGFAEAETSLDKSICNEIMWEDDLVEIADLSQDGRFNANPVVTGAPKIRFYSGVPLKTAEGIPLGSLCVIDMQTRQLNDHQRFALRTLAEQVTSQLELRRSLIERENERVITDNALAHLNLMIESALDYAILSLDANGMLTSWNTGAELIFGYKADEVIGQDANIIFTPEDREQGTPEYELSMATSQGRASDERWHVRKNGERFYASGILASMHDSNGSIRGFIKIARDMTKERQAQEMLIEARNAAEAANIAKTEFLANMSHEIRTPMNAVIGLSNILAKSQPLTAKQENFIKTLQMSADSLLALINDLLDIAKIEARTVDLENVPLSLTQIMQEVMSMMGVRVREKGLAFTGQGECVENRLFMGDPARLRQIILNLCSNAIKFTDQGSVHVEIDCQVAADENTDLVCIAVRDTGIGIAADKLETIFHKFVQADSSINRKYGGTGLGLAITKTLTEIMGGTIKVESEPGIGSTFTVSVPLVKAAAMDIQQANGSLAETIRRQVNPTIRPQILLVEDYAPNVMVAKKFLEEFGYECDVASNGIEAVEKSRTGHFAAALMDVQMHGMNGFEATQLIREFEKIKDKKRLPIIGMTAHALSGDKERCLAVGMDDYIAKPFNPDELKEKIRVAVDS